MSYRTEGLTTVGLAPTEVCHRHGKIRRGVDFNFSECVFMCYANLFILNESGAVQEYILYSVYETRLFKILYYVIINF